MIRPVLQGDRFLSDVLRARGRRDGLHVWWMGQSGFLVQWCGIHLLFDPYLSDSLSIKYASTDKPHIRMTELVIDPARLDFIDFVTSSHNHTDHLDRETLLPLMRVNPGLKLLIPEANRAFVVERLKCSPDFPVGLDDGQSVSLGSIEFRAVPAAHELVERNFEGRCLFLGYLVRLGHHWLYHSGDTLVYDGLIERLRSVKIDLAFLPINGSRPERRVAGNMDGREAAQLAKQAGIRCVIPCHYEMFEFNTASPDRFIEECQRLDQKYAVLQCGEQFRLDDRKE